ncbi:MAG: peptide deformylase, partial [Nitrospinota bacterium]
MPIIDIVYYPESVLMTKCAPIKNIDDEVKDLANSMLETMYSAAGIGLAAPQVGVSKNLLIIDIGAQIE